MSAHPNSKIIKIELHLPLSHDNQKEAKEWIKGFRKSLGSYGVKGTKKIASGLNYNEEALLMPELVNVEPDDRAFRKEVEKYFKDISTRLPSDGKILEVGLKEDNSKSVSKSNFPLNVEDYVAYKHALGHPRLALNEILAKSSTIEKWCYIVDENKLVEENVSLQDLKDTARSLYLQNKNDNKKIAMYLTLFNEDIRKLPTRTADGKDIPENIGKRKLKLSDLVDAKPQEFIDIVGDKNLETKYLIEKLIQVKILKRVEKRILDSESGKEIGSDLEATVLYFADPTSARDIEIYKAKLKN